MATPALSYVVSRTGADLNLNGGASHKIELWHVPEVRWRRRTVTGSFQAGELITAAVPEAQVLPATVLCLGGTWDEVDAAENEMRVALQQFSYAITITTGGVVYQYAQCQPADITPLGEQRRAGEVAACIAGFALAIRCKPVIGSEA